MIHNSKRQIIGILWMIFHCFLISLVLAMARHTLDRGFNIFQVTFFYSIFAFLFTACWLLVSKKLGSQKITFKSNKQHLHILRAIFGVVSMASFFYALKIVPLNEARAIALIGPLVSSLFAIFFFKERIGLHRTSGLIIGFIGGLIIINPGGSDFSYASLLVVFSVFCWAAIDQIIKALGKTESTMVQIFYFTLFVAILAIIPALYNWKSLELKDLLLFILMGFVFFLNSVAVFEAFKTADINVLMPFDFTGMVFTIIIAYLAFGEIINFHTAIGSIIIIISSIYVMQREAKKAKEIYAKAPLTKV